MVLVLVHGSHARMGIHDGHLFGDHGWLHYVVIVRDDDTFATCDPDCRDAIEVSRESWWVAHVADARIIEAEYYRMGIVGAAIVQDEEFEILPGLCLNARYGLPQVVGAVIGEQGNGQRDAHAHAPRSSISLRRVGFSA